MKGVLTLEAIRGRVLGIPVYRGFGRLSDLARMSQPDVYDQQANPLGTQRDLNRRHAREAYEYVKNRDIAFFPEVVLHARDDSILEFSSVGGAKSNSNFGKLKVNLDRILEIGGVVLSRVDGNHRLHYADGHDPAFPPLDRIAGFSIIYGLPHIGVEEGSELILFRDINANQQGMNTSHLDSIDIRISPKTLRVRDPVLFIAERLAEESDSPFHERVYRGGVRPAAFMIPLRNLKTSIQYMQQRSKALEQFDADAQAKLIKRYWQAVQKWVPEAWAEPKKYVSLRGVGFWAVSFVGSDVIDRAVNSGKVGTRSMLAILRSGKDWDWSNSGDFRGFGGRAGAVEIANMVTKEFASEGPSISEIEAKLRG